MPPNPRFLPRYWAASSLLTCLFFLTGCSQVSYRCDPGVVLTEVQPGGAGERSGLRIGDVLLRWKQGAGAETEPGEGVLKHVFQLTWLEQEQAPRGAVTLTGTRNGKPFEKALPIGAWSLRARPNLRDAGLGVWRRAQAALGEKDGAGARELLDGLAVQASQAGDEAVA